MFHKCLHHLKGLKHNLKNEGNKLVITIEGDEKKIAMLEEKIKAMKTLMSGCETDCCDCCDEE